MPDQRMNAQIRSTSSADASSSSISCPIDGSPRALVSRSLSLSGVDGRGSAVVWPGSSAVGVMASRTWATSAMASSLSTACGLWVRRTPTMSLARARALATRRSVGCPATARRMSGTRW